MATLLIVEDDLKTNEAICEYLKPAGHTVIPAYDGEEALRLFRQNPILSTITEPPKAVDISDLLAELCEPYQMIAAAMAWVFISWTHS